MFVTYVKISITILLFLVITYEKIHVIFELQSYSKFSHEKLGPVSKYNR
jgi:hypothetical protein